jgi:Ca2+-binding RTX toxin-like protein
MAITATFLPGAGILTTLGDSLDNTITVMRDAAGTIRINNGAVAIQGGTPTVANTSLIQVFGQAGNDVITLNEANGALPSANLFGGAGNDILTGGSSADMLFGQSGNDTLFGKGGNDFLFGGDGNDTLTGGTGDDQVFGEAGNDRMIWNPGDGTDLFEGGADIDTAEVNGGNGSETFTITANGTRVRLDRVDPAPFSLDIGTTENLVINANSGNDVITAGNGLATLISLTIDGGAGNDTITGGDGADLLIGGTGDDLVNGGRGNDTAQLGAGTDTFVWNPGDGSDTVEGGSGTDTMLFNGANIAEIVDIAANGERVRFTRNVATITMDLNDVEAIHFNALGGADDISVHDLSGTDVDKVEIDLGAAGGTGDGASDVVTLDATNANNNITIAVAGSLVTVNGLPAQVTIDHAEATATATDKLVIKGFDGNDRIDASGLGALALALVLDGGAGNDTITGAAGNDMLIGGDGNDLVNGRQGDDVALLGAGDDRFVWNPGDGSDTVDGQDGLDTLDFNGANINERIDIAANGDHVRLVRDVASITMDLDGIETIRLKALGGADSITVGDLSATDVTKVDIDLAGTIGGTSGDSAVDSVTVNGTNNDDHITITSSGTNLTIDGLTADVLLHHVEATDQLTINGLGGNDVIDASGVAAGKVTLTINGGLGDDTVIGSAGDDLIVGGDGADVAHMGAGNDTFVWNPGDDNDTVEGQAGTDTLLFNGANISEIINISANGERALLTRDIATITMDLNDVETIDLHTLGGNDLVTVNDMTGTDVKLVHIDLGAAGGVPDQLDDTVVINGTNGDDVFTLTLENGALVVTGAASKVVIEHFDLNDTIRIMGLDGDDVINAAGLGANGPKLVLDGGNGDDVILGGPGNDTLLGGAGDDVLIGNAGQDSLDGGPGDNILIQDGNSFAATTTQPMHHDLLVF